MELQNNSVEFTLKRDFQKLINKRIEVLRLKLLDFTRRNPLISTKFSDRSNSFLRIVDCVPELLLQFLLDNDMRVVSLPSLGIEPEDEKSREFQDALTEARINDEVYLNSLEAINQESDEAPELLAQTERQLKDRVRQKLNMPFRQTKDNLSLQQHAKNHGISTNYDLPLKVKTQNNQDIQTLLLPDVLERRLNALLTKENSWKEETGISVLHIAFGFLEWEDGNNSSNLFSPLILIPLKLEKKRTKNGLEFWVGCDEAEPQENKILAEKLRLELNIILPEYTGQLEEYFKVLAKQKPKNITWNVRRWVTIGVFPSARLAMYNDLDTNSYDFASHSIVSTLIGGSNLEYGTFLPFAEEYNVDEPEIEDRVPYLITDADASQFSTIVDIVNGKNLAVEGPPGTGKSQTIVNTIASVLAAGKKVLFVAEKSAALAVVRSRLEAFGFGNFLLTLEANRSSKELVISSIRDRMEMKPCLDPRELDHEIKRFKEARDKLRYYVDTLSTTYGTTDFTIHHILGCSIKFNDFINSLDENIKKYCIPDIKKISKNNLQHILSKCKQIEDACLEIVNNAGYWNIIKLPNIDRFTADELIARAEETGKLFFELSEIRQKLLSFKVDSAIKIEVLKDIKQTIQALPNYNISHSDIEVAIKLTSAEKIEIVKDYLNTTKSWKINRDHILQYVNGELNTCTLEKLKLIKQLLHKYEINSLQDQILQEVITKNKKLLDDVSAVKCISNNVLKISEIFSSISIFDLFKVIELLSRFSRAALALRHEKLNDISLQIFLAKQINKGLVLRERRDSLNEYFILASLPEPEIIAKYAYILSNSHTFSFLNTNYREAKRFYRSVAKGNNFSKADSIAKLKDLDQWARDLKNYLENEAFKNILGLHFDGIDTDFHSFQEVIDFFKSVDQMFSDQDYLEVKHFLKYGDIQQMQSLQVPEYKCISQEIFNLKLLDIEQHVNYFERTVEECKADIKYLQELKLILAKPEETTRDKIIGLCTGLEHLLQTRDRLRENKDLEDIFGNAFQAEETNEDRFQESLLLANNLIKLNEADKNFFLYCIRDGILEELKLIISEILHSNHKAYSSLQILSKKTKTSPDEWLRDKSYIEFAEFMRLAAKDKSGLISYSRFLGIKNRLIPEGYNSFIEAILSSKQANNTLCNVVEALIMHKMAREVYAEHGNILVAYNGATLNCLRKDLQEADRKIIELSRQRLQSKLFYQACPPMGYGYGRKSDYTEMALLKSEISKKQRYLPVRSITKKATLSLLELKPCWLLSPLAVAQYLSKEGTEFDLVIIDEGSQMPPEDAIVALVRAKQAMIVGDTNQLSPTSFFRKMVEDDEMDEDHKVTEESILEMANLSFKPIRRLRWHYRSKHPGLISFSNKHIYNEDLVIFPSVQDNCPKMGVHYVKVDGVYSCGSNPQEAKIVVDSIIDFMKKEQGRSLGVVSLNQKQRDVLIEEIIFAEKQHQHVKEYIDKWKQEKDGLEPFFIKNLENVQGDERDVIFISTVYGPEKAGIPVMQRFGPINGIAGKRRLNVLLSRAKERIVTFSSMTASDIKIEGDGNPGVYMFKCWLEYAASGILESGNYIKKEPDSEFEEHVIRQINSIGCEAFPQIGVKGFSIDIGVKHPDWPHGFIMGIECDGAAYHSSRSARDRDRLRQEILEGLGWYLYRIWSTDWFEDPGLETKKLRQVITQRLVDLKRLNASNLIST
ncbi:Putative helicase domain protein (plasmid) [Candidatus Megaera polyxenophila]|nr:Putative helicase domain protein [Candidatus Megaera polyxenophila]